MNKLFCDRCGIEIDKENPWWYSFKINKRPNEGMYDFNFDCCKKCFDIVDKMIVNFIYQVQSKRNYKLKEEVIPNGRNGNDKAKEL